MRQAIRKRQFFPSLLILALVSHYVYYIDVFQNRYPSTKVLVASALMAMLIGFFFGYLLKPGKDSSFLFKDNATTRLDEKQLKLTASVFIAIGIFSHLYYYSLHPLTGYAASYGVGKGNGYITIFFNFWPMGHILNEYMISKRRTSKTFKVVNRMLMIVYVALYFFYLMKRRQVLLLFLAVMAIWGPVMNRGTRIVSYLVGIALLIAFSIFGKVRGFYDANGLGPTLGYISDNFSLDMLSIDEMEGKYISRTLDDVASYVRSNGCDGGLLFGILFCMLPRRLFPAKPLAFPEWYTYHFHPDNYAAGTGFAGSMVAELYLLGGIVAIVVGYYIVGFITARMQKRGASFVGPLDDIIYAIYIYTLIVLPRYDLASILTDFVFMYLPLIWAMKRAGISLTQKNTGSMLGPGNNQVVRLDGFGSISGRIEDEQPA